MNIFERKYGLKEDEKTISFHLSRRMFCIHQNKLFIAKPHLPYSHAVWFEREGWISEEKDELMNEIVRGFIDKKGNIYFYTGYEFEIGKGAESIFLFHLRELVEKLKLNFGAKIFGGLIKQETGKIWLPRKEYGEIENNL
ncbi:MAG: hypothetical protein Q8L27_03835 [archaeon]|nr:hypothetical protein [archaeon]